MKLAHIFLTLVIIAVAIVGMAGWRGHHFQATKKPAGSAMNQTKSRKDVILLSQQTMHDRAFIEIEF
jgi:hypothetical protein